MDGNISLLLLIIFPIIGAFIAYICGRKSKKLRNYVQGIITVTEFLFTVLVGYLAVSGGGITLRINGFMARGLDFEMDGFRAVYTIVAAFMWMMTSVFSAEYFRHYRNRNRYYFFMLLTLGATMGVLVSSDLFTTFCFFEIMSFTSYVWVAHDEKPLAMRAAQTYMAVAVIGGLVMLMGLLMLDNMAGTLKFSELYDAVRTASANGTSDSYIFLTGALILFGFGAKAGMFPLHIWLPKAHPVAPAPASALLSGILTKTGVFGIIVISCNIFRYDAAWGRLILVLGVITMFGGALLAVFSVDLKRTLACSSMSQIGFILVGIAMQCLLGDENALAARGTVLHMINHSMIKLVLFMVAGAVYMNLHKLNLNDVRGFGRNKPVLKFSFLACALSIGGIPLFSGYASKTLLHESIVEYIEHAESLGESTFLYHASEWMFLITGGMTIAYMTKLFVAVFIEEGEYEEKKNYISRQSIVAIVVPAVVLFILGVVPSVFMDRLANLSQPFMKSEILSESVMYFSPENLKGAAISIAIGAFVYFVVIRKLLCKKENGVTVYLDKWPSWLDIEDRIYRPLIEKLLPAVFGGIFAFVTEKVPDAVWNGVLRKTVLKPVSLEKKKSAARLKLEERLSMIDKGNQIIASSLSFGLLLISFGLCVTLFYLIGLLIS